MSAHDFCLCPNIWENMRQIILYRNINLRQLRGNFPGELSERVVPLHGAYLFDTYKETCITSDTFRREFLRIFWFRKYSTYRYTVSNFFAHWKFIVYAVAFCCYFRYANASQLGQFAYISYAIGNSCSDSAGCDRAVTQTRFSSAQFSFNCSSLCNGSFSSRDMQFSSYDLKFLF